jgi:hypothetical protein
MKGTTSQSISADRLPKRKSPRVIETKLAANIFRLPNLSASQPLLRRPAMLATGRRRAIRLENDLEIPKLLK